MGDISEFNKVSRHFAVQSLLNACYFETLHAAASFLNKNTPKCSCQPAGIVRGLEEQGLVARNELHSLRETCKVCRQSLEQAASAWEAGDAAALRERLFTYRQATGAVRSELIRLTK